MHQPGQNFRPSIPMRQMRPQAPPLPEPPPYKPQVAAQPPSQQQQLQQQQPAQVQRVPSMDSQPSEASEEGVVSEDLDNSMRDASQLDPGVQTQVEQQIGPLPRPKEGVNVAHAVVPPREIPAEQSSVVAAAAPAPLPTGPRVTVPVGWKRIVLLDSVIYYR